MKSNLIEKFKNFKLANLTILFSLFISLTTRGDDKQLVASPLLVNYSSMKELSKHFVMGDISLYVRKIEDRVVPAMIIQLFEKNIYLSTGIFRINSLLLLPKEKKIIFSNFEISNDSQSDGHLETNAIYEYDISTKKRSILLNSNTKDFIFFRKLIKNSNEGIWYKEIKVPKDEVSSMFQSIHSPDSGGYYFNLNKKLEDVKDMRLLRITFKK